MVFRGPRPKWGWLSTKLVATMRWCGGGQMPCVRPHSPWRGLEPLKGALSASTKAPEKGVVVVRVQEGMTNGVHAQEIRLARANVHLYISNLHTGTSILWNKEAHMMYWFSQSRI
jgi:hypothetical protein